MHSMSVALFQKNLIYDGKEDGYYEKKYQYSGNEVSQPIVFSALDLDYMENLRTLVGEKVFGDIIGGITSAKESQSFKGAFTGTENIPLRFAMVTKEDQRYLIVVSAGEVQSDRYKVYLEGIWILS